MSCGREWSILPSVTDGVGGTEQELTQLSGSRKEAFRTELCRKISSGMSAYYSVHKKEWEEFVRLVLQEEE